MGLNSVRGVDGFSGGSISVGVRDGGVLTVSRLSDEEKDLELLLLRQQLRIVERKQARGPQLPQCQKVPLAMLAVRL